MNERELLDTLKGLGIKVTFLAELADCSTSNLNARVNGGTYFTLDRLDQLYQYLRSEQSSSLEAPVHASALAVPAGYSRYLIFSMTQGCNALAMIPFAMGVGCPSSSIMIFDFECLLIAS